MTKSQKIILLTFKIIISMKKFVMFVLGLCFIYLVLDKCGVKPSYLLEKAGITQKDSTQVAETLTTETTVETSQDGSTKVAPSNKEVLEEIKQKKKAENSTNTQVSPAGKISYRIFPYQEEIRYKTNKITIDSVITHYIGGYLNYEQDKPKIYVNEYVPSARFKGTEEYDSFKKNLEILNSPIRRQLTLYHEFTHQLNNVYALKNLSRKDEILINKYDEISACLAELLLARELYIETGWEDLFQNKLEFYYKKGLKNKTITPQKGQMSEEEASFIINQLVENWCKDVERYYAQKEVNTNLNQTNNNNKPLSEEELQNIIKQFFAYEIGGKKINFLDYLKSKIELTTLELITVNSREIS